MEYSHNRQPGQKRPLSEKLNAALAWVITGSCSKAEAICGIPARTIRSWMQEASWADLVDEAKKIKQAELDSKFTNIIHKAVEEVADRLENGEDVITKNGDTVKRRVSAKDAAMIAAVLSDKRAILRGTPTSITKRESAKENLDKLKKGLEYVGKQPEAKEKTEDDETKVH